MSSGIAVFQGPEVFGTVRFEQTNFNVSIFINLHGPGLKPNGEQGFHIHEFGDLSDGCNSACAHYNPFGKSHGCPGTPERHVGDLGNLKTDLFGKAVYSTQDEVIELEGTHSIIGRSLIVHQNQDDCGQGVT